MFLGIGANLPREVNLLPPHAVWKVLVQRGRNCLGFLGLRREDPDPFLSRKRFVLTLPPVSGFLHRKKGFKIQ